MAFTLLLPVFSCVGCHRPPQPAQQPAKPTPYRIVELKDQGQINQCLIQVVVPEGSTEEQIQQWHNEIVQAHRHLAVRLFVNYYDGHQDSDRLVATNEGEGELIFYGH